MDIGVTASEGGVGFDNACMLDENHRKLRECGTTTRRDKIACVGRYM